MSAAHPAGLDMTLNIMIVNIGGQKYPAYSQFGSCIVLIFFNLPPEKCLVAFKALSGLLINTCAGVDNVLFSIHRVNPRKGGKAGALWMMCINDN